MIQLTIMGNPPTQTHQSSLRAYRIGKFCRIVKAKPSKETLDFHRQLELKMAQHQIGITDSPLFDGAVKLTIEFNFAHNKATTKAKQLTKFPKVTRPDLDNMAKTVLDGLTKVGCFKDDSQVSNLTLLKSHGPEAYTLISISHDN